MSTADAYWEATARELLMLARCADCRRAHHPPRAWCPHCGRSDLKWVVASGRGTLLSATVVQQGPEPDLPTPYVLAIVELEEGPRLMTNLIEASLESITLDTPVELAFEVRGGRTLPVFRPAEPRPEDVT